MAAAPDATSRAALPPSNAAMRFFERRLGIVGQSAVDVSLFSESEYVGGIVAAVENVRSRKINRNGSRTGGGIGFFLARVKLKGLEFHFVFVSRTAGYVLSVFECHFTAP